MLLFVKESKKIFLLNAFGYANIFYGFQMVKVNELNANDNFYINN